MNRSWLAFRFFNVVSFVYSFRCANVNSVGPPTRLPQAFGAASIECEWDGKATMIPPFDEHGYLPPGIHPATLEEVGARFGCESEVRRVQMESLRWLVDLARRAGADRLVINGSFVTGVLEPNDVDRVILIGAGFPRDKAAEAELVAGLPFLELETPCGIRPSLVGKSHVQVSALVQR